jgi:hypothetical protein
MANANTFIGVNAGNQGSQSLAAYTIQGTAPSTDFYFYFAAADGNSNTITREKAILALKGILGVLESHGTYTTEMEQ